jgi:hypothetical protein
VAFRSRSIFRTLLIPAIHSTCECPYPSSSSVVGEQFDQWFHGRHMRPFGFSVGIGSHQVGRICGVNGMMKAMQAEIRTLAGISSDNAATSIRAGICLGFGIRMSLSSCSSAGFPKGASRQRPYCGRTREH